MVLEMIIPAIGVVAFGVTFAAAGNLKNGFVKDSVTGSVYKVNPDLSSSEEYVLVKQGKYAQLTPKLDTDWKPESVKAAEAAAATQTEATSAQPTESTTSTQPEGQ